MSVWGVMMRLMYGLLACALVACDDADGGPGGAASCEDSALIAQCPPGSDPQLGSVAEAMCSGAAGTVISDQSGAATGNCAGTSQCLVACTWASPCQCGVESVTRDAVACMPCGDAEGCGNGICDAGESPESCAIDCGMRCMSGESRCGNNGGRQSCNLQGIWEDLACPDGQFCEVRAGQAECVLDIVGPEPEGQPDPEPGPDPEDNACWTFGPGEVPSDGAYLQPGDCRDLQLLGPAWGPVSEDGRYTLRFDPERGLLRYPTDVEVPTVDAYQALLRGCEAVSPSIQLTQRLNAIYDDDHLAQRACIHEALAAHCEAGQGEALFAALDGCAALEPPHLSLEAIGVPMDLWPPIFIRTMLSPTGRYALIRWRGPEDPSVRHLAVFDHRDQTFEQLEVPAGYNIGVSQLAGENPAGRRHFDFAYDQRTLVGMVQADADELRSALAVWDLQTGDVRLLLPGAYGRQPRVSPDGRFMYFVDDEAFIDLQTEQTFATFTCQADAALFGSRPVLERNGYYRTGWPFGEPDPELDRQRIAVDAQNAVVYSPDGSTMLFQGRDGLEIWDIATGARLAVLPQMGAQGEQTAVLTGTDCRFIVADGYLYGRER